MKFQVMGSVGEFISRPLPANVVKTFKKEIIIIIIKEEKAQGEPLQSLESRMRVS